MCEESKWTLEDELKRLKHDCDSMAKSMHIKYLNENGDLIEKYYTDVQDFVKAVDSNDDSCDTPMLDYELKELRLNDDDEDRAQGYTTLNDVYNLFKGGISRE